MTSGFDESLRSRYFINVANERSCFSARASAFKDVRTNCFCAYLLRTQIHTPRHAQACALSNKINNDRADGRYYSFAWI